MIDDKIKNINYIHNRFVSWDIETHIRSNSIKRAITGSTRKQRNVKKELHEIHATTAAININPGTITM